MPVVKTLEEFDFAFQPSIKREQIESLAVYDPESLDKALEGLADA